ncbi:septation protein A [Arsenophonus apicola]|uniref:Inner membrane-spanning protein YciB n=1 Tax=Arsenophonus apicola TaxID=2879119 RepID=A0ABY8NZX6_9GAMM|nr:septation protein A [Arsenophonus apicola]WGO82386.1 septation protein A [Arsenophonus apicola]
MRQLLDFIPLIVFFIVYKKVDIFYASGALMIATALSMLAIYFIYKKIEKSSLITLVIVIIFGGLTLIFHSDLFIKWKVTVIYAIFSLALLVSQYFTEKPLIQRMLGKEIHLANEFWRKLNLSWAIFFAICALVNIYVAFWLPQDVWVNFKVFGLTAVTLIFTILSMVYIYKHLPKEQK